MTARWIDGEEIDTGVVPQVLKRPVCPGCGKKDTSRVTSTVAPKDDDGARVQYRLCRSCSTRFKTVVI